MPDAEFLEQRLSAPFGVGPRNAVHVDRREPHVVNSREVLEEKVELEHHADLAIAVPARRVAAASGRRQTVEQRPSPPL